MFARVYRWREAMAQYEPGHIARVVEIEKRVAEIPGWPLPATPITASGCRTVFAPAWKPRASWHNSLRNHSQRCANKGRLRARNGFRLAVPHVTD